MPSNSPPGAFVPRPSTFRKLRFALPANAFPLRKWNTSPPTSSTRLPIGVALSILSLRPTLSRFSRLRCVLGQSKTLRVFFAPGFFCSSSPGPAGHPPPKVRCPGLLRAPSCRPSPPPVSKNFLSKIFSISKILENQPSAASAHSTVSQFEYFFLLRGPHLAWREPHQAHCILFQLLRRQRRKCYSLAASYLSLKFIEKETAMFQKLMNTADAYVVTLLRLVLGNGLFGHGAQKVLGWFGGFGFRATLGFFTQQMHIPAVLAVLAIAAEFLGGIGLLVGFLGRVAAFGIAINMIVAVVLVHRHFGLFANWFGNQKGEGYEYHILAIVICLAIMIRGSGALSIDHSASRQLARSSSSLRSRRSPMPTRIDFSLVAILA